jgi:arylsulfatase A-like enzyme/Tfp pilus assembly protein PilF
MRRADLVAALTISLLAGWACSRGGAAPRNLVLITLDTTRADHLGCYGSTSTWTPNLDAIAAGGTVFERAFTVAPITAPAHASILSGTYPPFSRVRDNGAWTVPRELPWLPEMLRERGFRTVGMIAAFPLRSGMGFGRGFDAFSDTLEAPAGSLVLTNLQTIGVPSRRGERISDEFRMWVESRDDTRPFFAWLHYYDPHWPYQPGAGYADLYVDRPYDGEIAYMDDCIGKVLQVLERNGLSDTTGLVVVGDHGESLGDHDEPTHALLAYNSTLRVPMMIRLPWLERQRARVNPAVSSADVTPTILDALGIEVADTGVTLQARSLLPLVELGPDEPVPDDLALRPLYFETLYPFHHYRWSPLSGFIEGTLKFIHGPYDELFDLGDDLDEHHPLERPDELASRVRRLVEIEKELRRNRPDTIAIDLSRTEIDQLRALGYVGGEAPVSDDEALRTDGLPHPHDRLDLFARYNEITRLRQNDQIAEALDVARSIAEENPLQKEARLMVATFSAQLARTDDADRAFENLVRDFPEKDVVFQAGTYFLNRRILDRARDCFQRLVAADPNDAESLTRLAYIASEQSDPIEARRLLEKALEVDHRYREALLALAVLLDREGDPKAGSHFESAASWFPFDPHANFDYGVYLLRTGRDSEGVKHLQRAAALAEGPLFDTAHLALAAFFEQRGDTGKARFHLRQVMLTTAQPAAYQEAQSRLAALEAN